MAHSKSGSAVKNYERSVPPSTININSTSDVGPTNTTTAGDLNNLNNWNQSVDQSHTETNDRKNHNGEFRQMNSVGNNALPSAQQYWQQKQQLSQQQLQQQQLQQLQQQQLQQQQLQQQQLQQQLQRQQQQQQQQQLRERGVQEDINDNYSLIRERNKLLNRLEQVNSSNRSKV